MNSVIFPAMNFLDIDSKKFLYPFEPQNTTNVVQTFQNVKCKNVTMSDIKILKNNFGAVNISR